MYYETLLKNSFGTPDMRKIWAEENMIQKWLDFEKAISLEMAALGMVPAEAAKEIAARSTLRHLNAEMIDSFKADVSHLIVSFTKAFAKMAGPAGEHYHVGPTTQDILLTGMTLQAREAYEALMKQLLELERVLLDKAIEHKHTVMMGRTHGQHAVPITFGFVIGIWAYEIRDHIERLKEIADRFFLCKLTAATGTRNTWVYLFGEKKTEQLAANVAKRIGLGNPPTDIGPRSDRQAELGFALANICGTLAKIGLDIRFLQTTEIGEVEEPWDSRKQYSSSTMPNKRNPEPSEWQDGLAKIARGNALALASITPLNERDATRSGPYNKCLPDNFLLASAALATAIRVFDGLVVHADRMRQNLYATKGISMSEAVMLLLWKKTGKKMTAHALMHDVAMEAFDKEISLKEALLANKEICRHLTPGEIEEVINPETYYGDAPEQVDRVAKHIRKLRHTDPHFA